MNRPAPPALEQRVRLEDGRKLGYAVFGDPSPEETIFWLHGTPGARRQIPVDARAYAEDNRLRIVGIDRPGVGWSTQHVYDNVLGFADDLRQLADDLAVERFHVVGLSGGGPYALAAGSALPDRVKSLGILGGVAPTVGPDAVWGGLVTLARPIPRPLVRLVRLPAGQALSMLIRAGAPMVGLGLDAGRAVTPPGDFRTRGAADVRSMFADDLVNGAQRQFSAVFSDVLMFTQDWGFRLSQVTVPVRWWHGRADHIVPYRHGKHVVSRLPDAELIPLEGEAHLGALGLAVDVIGGLVPAAELIDEVIAAED
ncbi:MAG: alpha/beta hydrolase [Nocardioidaceae bacterium]